MRLLIACMLLASSCGKVSTSTKAGKPCHEHAECARDLRCISGVCTFPLEAGTACTVLSRCADGLSCVNGKCAPPREQGEECAADCDCRSGLLCMAPSCRDMRTARKDVHYAVASYAKLEELCARADRLRKQMGARASKGTLARSEDPGASALEHIKAAQLSSSELCTKSPSYALAVSLACRDVFAGKCPPPAQVNPCAAKTAAALTTRLRRLQEHVGGWWVTREAACPKGASLRGGEPPSAWEIWCERPNGERHGRWTRWDPDGSRAEGSFADGKRDGPYAVWHKKGRKVQEGQYRAGEKTGRWIDRFLDGGKQQESVYESGQLHGARTSWHRLGQKWREESFANGKQHGRARAFAPSGKLLGSFEMTNGTGTWLDWHRNGRRSKQVAFVDGEQHGSVIAWRDDGGKAWQGNYAHGKFHGTFRFWRPDGTERGSFEMTNGTGTWIDWYMNGTKKREQAYQDGELHGPLTGWHRDGKKAEQGNHVRGKKRGAWLNWHKNGAKSRTGQYDEDGEPHGTWSMWDEDGNPVRTQRYEHGVLLEITPSGSGRAK